MGHSTNRHNELKQLLKDVFEEDYVVVLQYHTIWWFSRGNVMARLLLCMPTLLELFRDEEPHWYEIMCFFRLHFYLKLLIDGLHELNIKLQYDMVDITTTSATINIIISITSRHLFIRK